MFEVLIERGAERDIESLPGNMHGRVVEVLMGLKRNPYPAGCRRITGSKSDWRVRIGDYRAIYEVDQGGRTVRIMRIRHRREVYR